MTRSPFNDGFACAAASLLTPARQRLADYVRHETPTGDAEALDALADVLVARYDELGASVERVPSPTGDHVVARWGSESSSEPHVLLLGHHDTVWPVGRLETMPLGDDAGTIRGPGVFDMKGGLIVAEMALEVLAQCGTTPSRPVRLVVSADEEVGSPTAREVVEANMSGAVAALGLESPHPDGGLKSARRGSTRVRIEASGREAHAALDLASGVSAVDELIDQLLAVRETVQAEPSVLANVGTIGGGRRTNVVAGHAHAEIGLRFVDLQTERRVCDRLASLQPVRPGAQLDVQTLSSRPAWAPGGNEDLLGVVVKAGAAVGQNVTAAPAAGAADTNITGAAGLPTLDGFGPRGQGAHAAHEQIQADSLAERAALLASVLARL